MYLRNVLLAMFITLLTLGCGGSKGGGNSDSQKKPVSIIDSKPNTKDDSKKDNSNSNTKDHSKPNAKDDSKKDNSNSNTKDDSKPNTKDDSKKDNSNSNTKDDSKPKIKTDSEITIKEGQKDIITVEVEDKNPLTYSLEGEDSKYFKVDDLGEITLKQSSNYETKKEYKIKLIVKNKTNESSKDLTIKVLCPYIKGKFIDRIGGVSYITTSGVTGNTKKNGEFNFRREDKIKFYINGIVLGEIKAKKLINPLDLANTQDIQDFKVIQLLVLLQSLDEDEDSSNGIFISKQMKSKLSSLNIDLSKNTKSKIRDLLISKGIDPSKIKAENDVLQNFKDTLNSFDIQYNKKDEYTYRLESCPFALDTYCYVYRTTYNSLGKILKYEKSPYGIDSFKLKQEYRYDKNGNEIYSRMYDEYSDYENPYYTETTYDTFGNMILKKRIFLKDNKEEIIKQNIYNENNLLTKKIYFDFRGRIEKTYTYDNQNRLIKEEEYKVPLPSEVDYGQRYLENETTYEYNERGLLSKKTSEQGPIYSNGNKIVFVYKYNNNDKLIEEIKNNITYNEKTIIKFDDDEEVYYYENINTEAKTIGKCRKKRNLRYRDNSYFNLNYKTKCVFTFETRDLNGVFKGSTVYDYDDEGYFLSVKTYDENNTLIKNTERKYDKNKHLLSKKTYDENNSLVSGYERYNYVGNINLNSKSYKSFARGPNGDRKEYAQIVETFKIINGEKKLIKEEFYETENSSKVEIVSYDYDENANLIHKKALIGDKIILEEKYIYYSDSKLKEFTSYDSLSEIFPKNRKQTYVYTDDLLDYSLEKLDSNFNKPTLIKTIDKKRNTLWIERFVYDDKNRPILIFTVGNGSEWAKITWNDKNQVIKKETDDETITTKYNDDGSIKKELYHHKRIYSGENEYSTYEYEYSQQSDKKILTVKIYNEDNELEETFTKEYDSNGLLVKDRNFTLIYNKNNQLIRKQIGEEPYITIFEKYTYDELDRVKKAEILWSDKFDTTIYYYNNEGLTYKQEIDEDSDGSIDQEIFIYYNK